MKRQKYNLKLISVFLLSVICYLLSAFPASAGPVSTNYELKDYGFGGGGTTNSTSTNYSVLGIAGEAGQGQPNSTNYKAGGGLVYTMMADIPPAPAFTNPANYYNKLKLIINEGGNSSDAKYAIAISTDNFVSDTKYIQNDYTVGPALGFEDWQTYASWGGAAGFNLIGLSTDTTYTVKVAAKQGNFTETGYGPAVSAATVPPSLAFDIDVAPTDTKTDPPYTITIGELTPATVVTAPDKVWVDLSTNGTGGGNVYINDTNNGLNSPTAGYTIAAVTNNLSLGNVTEGYGARGSIVYEASGGPMEIAAPYNGSEDNVGALDGNKRIIFDSSAEVTGGRAAFEIKAKASNVTRAASDYNDTVTVIASATF